ncbi:MAG: lamin tail domain-containing protein [Chloroflexota bacterium]|nr:MAG: lamin tail domain-containing protein [Chloroflexota bacterium]
MKKIVLLSLFIIILLFLPLNLNGSVKANNQPNIFLPIVNREIVVTTGNIWIITIRVIGSNVNESDEYVEIRNEDTVNIQLLNWTLTDYDYSWSFRENKFTFPSYVIKPGEICRVYTNENHPEWCGFNWKKTKEIWPNSAGHAFLWDSERTLIFDKRYIFGK